MTNEQAKRAVEITKEIAKYKEILIFIDNIHSDRIQFKEDGGKTIDLQGVTSDYKKDLKQAIRDLTLAEIDRLKEELEAL